MTSTKSHQEPGRVEEDQTHKRTVVWSVQKQRALCQLSHVLSALVLTASHLAHFGDEQTEAQQDNTGSGGIGKWKVQRTKNSQKSIAARSSTIWREKNEGRREGSPLVFVPSPDTGVRTTGSSGQRE